MEKYTVHYSSSKRDPKTGKNGSNANGSGGDKKGSGNTLDEMNGKKSKPDNSTPYSEVSSVDHARGRGFLPRRSPFVAETRWRL